MFIYYRNFPYSPAATLISAFSNFGAMLAAAGAVLSLVAVYNGAGFGFIVLAAVLAGVAALLFLYVGRELLDKLGEKWSEKNIHTKARYAMMYCQQHPEAYAQLAAENPDFAQKWMLREDGKIVKRK